MALESVDYSEEKACKILEIVMQDDKSTKTETKQEIKGEPSVENDSAPVPSNGERYNLNLLLLFLFSTTRVCQNLAFNEYKNKYFFYLNLSKLVFPKHKRNLHVSLNFLFIHVHKILFDLFYLISFGRYLTKKKSLL